MPHAAKHSTSHSAASSRSKAAGPDAIKLLKADHAEVSSMFEKYENGRLSADRKQRLARQICAALTIHAQIEEEIFYPAAREVETRDTEPLLDEAEIEHGSLKELIADIEAGSPQGDELFDARVKVLSEYVKHHVKEEEGELFPKIKKSRLDLQEVGERLTERKEELASEMNVDA